MKTSELKKAIKLLKTTIKTKSKFRPVLKCVVIENKNGLLNLSGTDLDINVNFTVTSDIAENFSAAVDFAEFEAIIKASSEVSLLKDTNILKVNGINLVDNIDDFPMLPLIVGGHNKKVNSAAFIEAIESVESAVSHDETRLFLNGIYFEIDEKNIVKNLVATDGYRLNLKTIMGLELSLENSVIMPRQAIKAVKELLKGTDTFSMQADSTHLYFITDNGQVSARLIAREFLKYNQVIPSKVKASYKFKIESILSAIDKIMPLVEIAIKVDKIDKIRAKIIKLELKENGLNLVYREQSFLIESNNMIELFGLPSAFGLNLEFLTDAVNSFDKKDSISWGINAELSPVLLANTDGLKCLLMPVKL